MAFDAFALMLAMLALGAAFARFKVLPDNAAEVLNRIVLLVCLPAAVLIYVPRLQVDASLSGIVAVPWLLALATVAAVIPLSRALRWPRERTAVLLMCVALGNSSFIGYPMVRALLGDDALPYAVVYDQFGTFVLLSTFGLYVLAHYGGDAPPTTRDIARRMLTFPPVWALLIGLTVMPAQPPQWIAAALQKLADALLPLAMLAVGLSMRLPREEAGALAVGLGLKLVVMPTLALGLALEFGMHGDMLRATVLEAAMPSMITAAALVGYGIVLSMVTLPLWATLLAQISER